MDGVGDQSVCNAGAGMVGHGNTAALRAQRIQREVAVLRKNIEDLREFLRCCQNMINSETAKLEKQCLCKIKSLEEERSEFERKLLLALEEKKIVVENASKSEKMTEELVKKTEIYKEQNAKLQGSTQILESRLKAKTEQYASLIQETEVHKLKCLKFENELASSRAYVQEQKVVFGELLENEKQLRAENSNLKLQIAETEAYEAALQEHLNELEGICAVLRDQLDQQQKYFMQKEVSWRKDENERHAAIVREKKALTNKIEQMQLERENLKTEINGQTMVCEKIKKLNENKQEEIEKVERSLNAAEAEITVEKSTVSMLTQKNSELSLKLVQTQSEIRHLQDKLGERELHNSDTLNKKALQEVENTFQQYFNGQRDFDGVIERGIILRHKDKLIEYEKELADERKHRLSAEIQVENLKIELEKSRVESAVRRNNSVSRRSKTHKSKKILFSKNDERLGKTSDPLHKAADESHNIVPSSNHIGPNAGTGSNSGSPSVASDSEFSNNEFAISVRASRKAEEANKRALALLEELKSS